MTRLTDAELDHLARCARAPYPQMVGPTLLAMIEEIREHRRKERVVVGWGVRWTDARDDHPLKAVFSNEHVRDWFVGELKVSGDADAANIRRFRVFRKAGS